MFRRLPLQLVDWNPSGAQILLQYRFGSRHLVALPGAIIPISTANVLDLTSSTLERCCCALPVCIHRVGWTAL
jgi:hypothetical protein